LINNILLLRIFYKNIFIKKKSNNKNIFIYSQKKYIKHRSYITKTENQSFQKKNKIKEFLSKITNSKINIIFINGLSFIKFFYFIAKKKKKEKFNIFKIQKMMLNKYKYDAILIKDFVHLAFICVTLKNVPLITLFIAELFKRLPKNRKQFKLLNFINQTLKILCQQRKEVFGFKLQITGRLNRRKRTRK
jgi:hypothetical protein